jgi:multidrug efflux system outer membrane protein
MHTPKAIEDRDCGVPWAVGFISLVLLAGCAIGPNYKRPAVDAPNDFRFATSPSTNSFADLPWWEVFKDPT